MAEDIEFKAKIDTADSVAKLKELTKKLKEVEVGTEKFNQLQRQIDDTKDSIAAARTGAGNFFEILGQLPGPIGTIGSALANTVTAIKQFTLIKFSAIGESLVELGKDFVDIGKNILDTTGITKLYEATTVATTKVLKFFKIEVEASSLAVRGFSAALIATGIGAIIIAIGLLAANWDKVTDSIIGATDETKDYNAVNAKAAEISGEQITTLETLIKRVNSGTLSQREKNKAVNEYNEKLGDTLGKVKNYAELEAKLIKDGPKYIQYLKTKALAEAAYQLSIEKGKEALKKAAEDNTANASWQDYLSGIFESKDLGKTLRNQGEVNKGAIVTNLKKQQGDFLEIFKTAQADADKLANELNIKLPEVKVEGAEKGALDAAKKQIQDYIDLGRKALTETKFSEDSLIAGRQKELESLKSDYETKIAAAKKFNLDQSLINLSYEEQKLAVNKKYNDSVNKSIEDFINKSQELKKNDRQKDLDEAKATYDKLIVQANQTGQDTTALTQAYKDQQTSINKKYDEQELQAKNDFNAKVQEILTGAITNDVEREKKVRQDKLVKDLADLEKDKEFIKLEEEEKNKIRLALKTAAENDITNMDATAEQTRLDEKLRLLELNGQALLRGTASYYDNKRLLIDGLEQKELADLKLKHDKKLLSDEEFEKAKLDIQNKYTKQRKDVSELELNDYLGYASNILGAINGIFSAASNVQKMQQEQDIQNAEGNTEKIEEIKKKGFEDNKKMQIAQAIIGTLQSAIQAYQSLAVIPVVGPVLGAAAAAAALVFGYKQVALIKSQKYQSSGGAQSSSAGGAGVAAPTAPTVQQAAAPQINTGVAQNPQNQIAQTLAQTTNKPIEAFVVSTSVSSQQQLDRRTNRAATL